MEPPEEPGDDDSIAEDESIGEKVDESDAGEEDEAPASLWVVVLEDGSDPLLPVGPSRHHSGSRAHCAHAGGRVREGLVMGKEWK